MSFVRFWWEFIVGDDPWLAAGVIAAIAVTAWLASWWLLPLAVAVLLLVSLRRAAR